MDARVRFCIVVEMVEAYQDAKPDALLHVSVPPAYAAAGKVHQVSSTQATSVA